MNRIPYAGHNWGNGRMVMHINLTEFGQGWHSIEIPIAGRRKALQAVERKIEQYKSDSNYRRNIGPDHNIDAWLNDIVTYLAA